MASLLIKGGRVVDPSQSLDKKTDILIENGKVTKIGGTLRAEKVIDANNCVVLPGFVDLHVHLRQPGREDEETVKSGQRAAIAGGVTTICCMPNTQPVTDEESIVEYIIKEQDKNFADVFPVGAITKGLKGNELAEMGSMARAGAVAFSDDGECVMDSSVMLKACLYSKAVDRPLIVHAEDKSLTADAQMHEGLKSTELGLKGAPSIAEEFIVARDIMIASYTGARIHFAHVSTAGSVDLVRKAKEKKLNITAEVTPHHLVLDDGYLEGYDSNYKVNPPLRGIEDKEALIEGLLDGTIDAIATDHAPHSLDEKEKEFAYAPSGIIGLETLAGIIFGKLVAEGKVSIGKAVAKLTEGPAAVLGLNKGTLKEGSNADVVILDLNKETEIRPEKFMSLSRNMPYGGWKVKASVEAVIKNGKLVYKDGDIVGR